ncbi:hypothetical protein [Polaromonas sp. SM01]|uniref:hypothetical protein n=1 Tax=Polaromonas sp. SM01 TaxID=3085630 RepID=UPI00298223E2|nr:hypothetical protein [Polaromonas sp. SM01]MDW5444779.1 hypothetical protein [Polaromonas sp. SM01]
MLNALLDQTVSGQTAEAQRHAYNAAFEELGLTWHWDAATYARLQAHGRNAVRVYLETEQAHLLRAYEADFLVNAIAVAQARSHASMGGNRARPTPSSWLDSAYGYAPDGPRQHAPSSTPTHRPASIVLT